MSGHSKWHNIMHRKGAQDRARSGIFTKLAREITMAAKNGDSNPDNNPRLRLAILNARKESMPNDNIKRAIEKASGSNSENYESVRYEGYGPGAVPVIVEALSDNPRRTVPDVRHIFSKHGGNMGENGSVSFMFSHVGTILYNSEVGDEDTIFEKAVNAGADNMEKTEDGYVITTSVDNFGSVVAELNQTIGEPESAKLSWVSNAPVEVDAETADRLDKFVEEMEDNDDVQEVFVGADY